MLTRRHRNLRRDSLEARDDHARVWNPFETDGVEPIMSDHEANQRLPNCRVFIATSLDGYIARDDGDIDWLETMNERVPEGEDFGYGEFMSGIDALVMGRNSFEMVMSFPQWPYGSTPVAVLSRSLRELPASAPSTVSLHSGSPIKVTQRLREMGFHNLYIDGGLTIQGFLRAGLIQEMIVTTVPILIGSGKPLFGPLEADIELELVGSKAYPFGFVQNRYRVGACGNTR